MTCRLCDNPASYRGHDGDPDDPRSREIVVCGLHMTIGDEPIPGGNAD